MIAHYSTITRRAVKQLDSFWRIFWAALITAAIAAVIVERFC